MFEAQGDLAAAEPLFCRALEIDEKNLGPGHPSLATGFNNLGVLYSALGDVADEKAFGSGAREVANDLNNLAAVLSAQGNLTEAEQFYRRALAIYEQVLGPGNPSTRRVEESLDKLLRKSAKTNTPKARN